MDQSCLSLTDVLAIQIGVIVMFLCAAWIFHSSVTIIGEAMLAERREREQKKQDVSVSTPTDPLIQAGLEKRTSYYAKKAERL